MQNLVCFSGPSQGLPPNWGGLQVRVRSRKPRPHVLEHRLQGDHSSQAPCTAEGQEGAAELWEPWTLVPRALYPARTLAARPVLMTLRPRVSRPCFGCSASTPIPARLCRPAPPRPPTWTHGRVVAQPLLAQGPAALRAVGGGHAEARAGLPALAARAGAHTPRGPLLGRGVTYGPRPTASQACRCLYARTAVRPRRTPQRRAVVLGSRGWL